MSEAVIFAEGDVVEHKKFGIGTVKEVEYRGPVKSDEGGGNGYRVMVAFNEPDGRELHLMSWALSMVSSPDTRPFVYWDKQWQPLREQWLNARREVELLCKTFEPPPDEIALATAIEAEHSAWMALQAFIVAPRL